MAASAFIILRCSSFQFYIKPQPCPSRSDRWQRCSSFQFYIKPQHPATYLCMTRRCSSFQFYIKPQLFSMPRYTGGGCSSFQFYIKPQLRMPCNCGTPRCSSFQFYIKPQPGRGVYTSGCVVPHSNSTSNHNVTNTEVGFIGLFLIPILHQTTTSRMAVIHILHVTHMTPMHKTSCRTPGKLVGCNFVFQRAIYQKNSSC